jgi:hypothetical protein
MALAGVPPAYSVRFGEPLVGTLTLESRICDIPQKVYRNFGDVIARMPWPTPFFQCCPSYRPLTRVKVKPGLTEYREFGPFAWHHMRLYRQAAQGQA